jgi:hypothetical protein
MCVHLYIFERKRGKKKEISSMEMAIKDMRGRWGDEKKGQCPKVDFFCSFLNRTSCEVYEKGEKFSQISLQKKLSHKIKKLNSI